MYHLFHVLFEIQTLDDTAAQSVTVISVLLSSELCHSFVSALSREKAGHTCGRMERLVLRRSKQFGKFAEIILLLYWSYQMRCLLRDTEVVLRVT